MALEIAVINTPEEIQNHKADMQPEPTLCGKCGFTAMMNIPQTIEHYKKCKGKIFRYCDVPRK